MALMLARRVRAPVYAITRWVGNGDFRAQATQCFENLKAGLAAAGATSEHQITCCFIDISHLPIFLEVRDRYVNTKAPPASTAIQIGKLAVPGALFEIEAIAVVPEK